MNSTPRPSKHLTTAEACDLLRCDATTLRRYARDGKFSRIAINPRKVLYIRSEIEDYIAAHTYRAETLSEKRASRKASA